jgi:integrase
VNRALLIGRHAAVDLLGPDVKAADITSTDIKAVLRQAYERGSRSMAHHLRGYLAAAFNYGIKHENDYTRTGQDILFAIESNPVMAVPVDPGARRVGERVLTPEEIKLAWYDMPLHGATAPIHMAIKLILAVGGQRVMEVCEAREEEFDLDRRLWTIPKGRTKNAREHVVP